MINCPDGDLVCLYDKHKSTFEEIFYGMNNSLWKLGNILKDFKYKEDTENSYAFSDIENTFFVQLYKLISHTRDISRVGMGDRNNTYAQLAIWNYSFPELAKGAMVQIVSKYGCWRDIRQFCNYYLALEGIPKTRVHNGSLPILPDIVNNCIDLMSNEIQKDVIACYNKDPISNASKWCPREKNKEYGWLFFHIACRFFKTEGECTLKLCKQFRSILTMLNIYNNTPQVNFCNNTWDKINMEHISHKTYFKNKSAIHNLTRKGNTRYPNSIDRELCSTRFFLYGNQFNSPCKSLNSNYLSGLFRSGLVNKIINVYNFQMRNQTQFIEIDREWNIHWESQLSDAFTDIIPIIDTSIAMKNCDIESNTAFINAITIAGTILKHQNKIRRSNKYTTGPDKMNDTLLCNYANYDESSQFKTLDVMDDTITSVLTHLTDGLRSNYNTTPNGLTDIVTQFDFSKFYDLFLMKLVYEKHHPDIANKKTLLFMCADLDIKKIQKKIKKKYNRCMLNYHRTGIKLTGFPYVPPKIIVWNMSSSISELPKNYVLSIGTKLNKSIIDINIINSHSNSRFNGFDNFTEQFLTKGKLNNSFSPLENIQINLNNPHYNDFNPFFV